MRIFVAISIFLWVSIGLAESSKDVGKEQKEVHSKCEEIGFFSVDKEQKYSMSRGRCGDQWNIWLSKNPNPQAESSKWIVVDHVTVRKLNKNEDFTDAYYCYLGKNRDKREDLYSIFDLSKKGTVKNGKGKMIEAWQSDIKAEKIKSVSKDFLSKVKCESESDE